MQQIALIPLVTGLVQLAKGLGLPSKYAPVTALGAGVVLQLAIAGSFGISLDIVLQGVVIGLSSSGLYSAGKSVVKKK